MSALAWAGSIGAITAYTTLIAACVTGHALRGPRPQAPAPEPVTGWTWQPTERPVPVIWSQPRICARREVAS
jgi:hypothetical protein